MHLYLPGGSSGAELAAPLPPRTPSQRVAGAWQLPPAIKRACVQAVRSMAKHQEGGSSLLFFQQRRRIRVLPSALIRNVEFLLFGFMSLGS